MPIFNQCIDPTIVGLADVCSLVQVSPERCRRAHLCVCRSSRRRRREQRRRAGWGVFFSSLASTSKMIMRNNSVRNGLKWFLHKPKHNIQLILFIYVILSLNNFNFVEKIWHFPPNEVKYLKSEINNSFFSKDTYFKNSEPTSGIKSSFSFVLNRLWKYQFCLGFLMLLKV